jgi:hypothetical protein
MTKITKALIGTAAATAMAVSATSAVAQHRGYHDNDKISAGEVIAGAVILGGIAAILTSGKNKRNDRGYDDRGYDNGGYDDRGGYHNGSGGYDGDRRDGSRAAVERCVRKAENWASRYGNAKVTEIRDIQRTYDGYQVRGKIVVRDGHRGRGYDNYNRGGYDEYGRNGYGNNNYNDGKFTCYVERGRVVDVQYKGLGR